MVSNSSPIEKIALVLAMDDEAKPIIDRFKMKKVNPVTLGFHEKLQVESYQAKIGDKEIYLIKNGKDPINGVDRVGTQAAAVTTYALIAALKPHLIISAGTAGGLKNADIGDVYISNSQIVYCDRVISLHKYKEYGEGHFNYLSIPEIAKPLGIKLGKIATGNSLDPSKRDLVELKRLGADVVDMEAAAIAEVAQRFDVPFIALKTVTNFLNTELHMDFLKNYKIAVSNLSKKIGLLIPILLGKTPSEFNHQEKKNLKSKL